MNRRELFGSASAFPLAVIQTDTMTPSEPPPSIGDQLYHVVYLFDEGVSDFRLAGIYTLESDALAQLNRIKKLQIYTEGHVRSLGTARVNHSWVENFFVKARLGEIKEVMERVEQLVRERA